MSLYYVPINRWPNIIVDAAIGDVLYYCYHCSFCYNLKIGTGPSHCSACGAGLRVWKVEEGEKEQYERWLSSDQRSSPSEQTGVWKAAR